MSALNFLSLSSILTSSCLAVFSTPLFSAQNALSTPDIVQLASKAALGKRSAMKALVKERRRLLETEDGSQSLSPSEATTLEILTRVLVALSPRDASANVRHPLSRELEGP